MRLSNNSMQLTALRAAADAERWADRSHCSRPATLARERVVN